MSNSTQIDRSIIESLISNSTVAETQQKKRPVGLLAAGATKNPFAGQSPLAVAYFLILEAVNTGSHTAVIQSKELNSNALAQRQANNGDKADHWFSIPKEKKEYYTKTVSKTKWEWRVNATGKLVYTDYVYTVKEKKSKVINKTQIEDAEIKNQQVVKEREGIQNKLKVLQQSAQVYEAKVNNTVDETMQTMQEGAQIMQMLRALTFKALIRQEPSAA